LVSSVFTSSAFTYFEAPPNTALPAFLLALDAVTAGFFYGTTLSVGFGLLGAGFLVVRGNVAFAALISLVSSFY
jgi:hypothetical protein